MTDADLGALFQQQARGWFRVKNPEDHLKIALFITRVGRHDIKPEAMRDFRRWWVGDYFIVVGHHVKPTLA